MVLQVCKRPRCTDQGNRDAQTRGRKLLRQRQVDWCGCGPAAVWRGTPIWHQRQGRQHTESIPLGFAAHYQRVLPSPPTLVLPEQLRVAKEKLNESIFKPWVRLAGGSSRFSAGRDNLCGRARRLCSPLVRKNGSFRSALATRVTRLTWLKVELLLCTASQQIADIISTVKFDRTGDFLASGDCAGRVVLFQRNQSVNLWCLTASFHLSNRRPIVNTASTQSSNHTSPSLTI